MPSLTSFYIVRMVKQRRWNPILKEVMTILLVALQLLLLAFGGVLLVAASHGLRLNSQINAYHSPRGKYSLDMQSSSDGCTYQIYRNRGWYQTYIEEIKLFRSCNLEGMNWQWNSRPLA